MCMKACVPVHPQLLSGSKRHLVPTFYSRDHGLSPEHRSDVVAGQNAHFARSER